MDQPTLETCPACMQEMRMLRGALRCAHCGWTDSDETMNVAQAFASRMTDNEARNEATLDASLSYELYDRPLPGTSDPTGYFYEIWQAPGTPNEDMVSEGVHGRKTAQMFCKSAEMRGVLIDLRIYFATIWDKDNQPVGAELPAKAAHAKRMFDKINVALDFDSVPVTQAEANNDE